MEIRYKPDALYHAYKTVHLETFGDDMTDQKRRIEDKLPSQPLDWSDAQSEQTRTDGVDWRPYHSALSQCADLLDNMKDGDPITDTPRFLAEKLETLREAANKCIDLAIAESQSQAAQPSDEQLRETDGYKLGWMEGMQEGAELATGGEKTAADVEAEFADLLPGSYYMDPPDGGSPSVFEQISRIAEDAAQWRAHLAGRSQATHQPSEKDIPADAPRAFAKRYTELLEKSRVLEARNAELEAAQSQATKVQAVPVDQGHVLRTLRSLLDGSQPKDTAGALAVIDNALKVGIAWSYDIAPPAGFVSYVKANYTGDVHFHDPEWHAVRLWNAAMKNVGARLTPTAQEVTPPRPTDDHLWDETLRDRDTYHEWADKLAEAIAKHFGADIGEHSNMNCPWAEALEVIENATGAAQEVTQQAGAVAEWVNEEQGFQYLISGRLPDGTQLYTHPVTATQQAAPTAWLATDLDGRGDVAFTKEEAKRRAGEGCTEFFPLYDIAPATQQAAKAETAEQALADLMPKRSAFIAWARNRRLDVTEEKDDWGQRKFGNYLVQLLWEGWFNAPATYAMPEQMSTAGAAKGGEDKPNSSDLAPTTSTVSAPDSNLLINVGLEMAANACEAERVEDVGPTDAAYNLATNHCARAIRNLKRTVSASGSADTGSAA